MSLDDLDGRTLPPEEAIGTALTTTITDTDRGQGDPGDTLSVVIRKVGRTGERDRY